MSAVLARSVGPYCRSGAGGGASGTLIMQRRMWWEAADRGVYAVRAGWQGRARGSGPRESGEPVNTDDAVEFA